MSDLSARLALPFIAAAQAQKHVTHNEAVEALDALVQLTVQAFDAVTPPGAPEEGQVWALGTGAVNAWSGQDGRLAVRANGGWRFVTPAPGWRAALGPDLRVWDGAAWVRPALPALQNLPGVGIGTSHDGTNVLAVAGAASLFSHAGAGHQVKINKAGAGQTASVLFQTGFAGRAEIGTTGSDDLVVKVSADGAAFTEAMRVAAPGGAPSFPAGAQLPPGSAAQPALRFAADADTGLFRAAENSLGFAAGGLERMALSDGGLRIGAVPAAGSAGQLQLGAVGAAAAAFVTGYDASATGPVVTLAKSRAAAVGGADLVQAGDNLGVIRFNGADGTDLSTVAAEVIARCEGTPAVDDIRARLFVRTRGTGGLATALWIDSAQNVGVATAAAPTTRLQVNGPVRVGSYTVGTVPSAAASGAGSVIYVSNEAGGACLAFSDGTGWRRPSDRAIIS